MPHANDRNPPLRHHVRVRRLCVPQTVGELKPGRNVSIAPRRGIGRGECERLTAEKQPPINSPLAVPANVADADVLKLVTWYANRLHNQEPEGTPPATLSWDDLCAVMSNHRGG
jgi:hypothetical protein